MFKLMAGMGGVSHVQGDGKGGIFKVMGGSEGARSVSHVQGDERG